MISVISLFRAEGKRLNKKMGYKALDDAQYRSNLWVVRIWARRGTQ